MVQYYATEERAMAPGISGEWPDVILLQDNPNGRLVKVDPIAAGLTKPPSVVDRNGVELKPGQTVKVGDEQGTVVTVSPLTPTANRKGHWVDIKVGHEEPTGEPSYLLEVVGETPEPSIYSIGAAIVELVQVVHYDWAVPCGWWNDLKTGEALGCNYPAGERPKGSKSVGDQIALIHSEISEAYEGHRKNRPDEHLPQYTSFEVELADAMIRILDTAGGLNLRLAEAFESKMEYNRQRADHKPENRRKEDGKKT